LSKDYFRTYLLVQTYVFIFSIRCFASAAQPVYSNFSFLLSEAPIAEPSSDNEDTIEEMFNEGKTHKNMREMEGTHEDEDRDIEWDDRLHFPAGEREIDISKQVRDIIHLEVNMNVVCSANCKGVCLQCGSNLNLVKCTCVKTKSGGGTRGAVGNYGPLKDLKKKMGKSLG
jgi:Large ribosomal RNA subunit accumulation protein YceD